jgi:subtilase family serine protease
VSAIALGLAIAPIARAESASDLFTPKNVARWVGHAQKVGAAPDSKRVEIAAFLSFRNLDELKKLVADVSKPGSPQFRHYLTPDEFRARFAPKAADVKLVQDTLTGLGFKIENTPKSGLFVEASGTVAQVKAAFHVSQDMFSYSGKTLRANHETPNLPAKIANIVTYVGGLDDSTALLKPHHVTRSEEDAIVRFAKAAGGRTENAPPPVNQNLPEMFCTSYFGTMTATLSTQPTPFAKDVPYGTCGYTPQQIRAAYGVDRISQTGAGVRVGIVDVYASPTIIYDVNTFSKHYGLPQLNYLNYQQILPPGIFNVPANDPCGPQGWYNEETLDHEAVHSMAPGAYIVFGAIACTDPGNAPLYNMIDNHLADVITNSYGFNGESVPTDFINAENQFFMQAAVEGISVLFSTGDNGDQTAYNGIASGSWEATSPYVTAVGGTSLALYDATGKKTEWGWGTYRASLNNATVSSDGSTITTSGIGPFAFYAGAGGGPSLSQLGPDYQAGVPYTMSWFTTLANGTKVPFNAPHRVTPDIAMDADPYTGFLVGETYQIAGTISDTGCKPIGKTGNEYCEIPIGGTSLASPLAAGVVALLDQALAQNGFLPAGFLNPILYQLDVGPAGSTAPLIDVLAPKKPTAVLRTYLGNPNKVRLVTINSGPNKAGTAIVEGLDTSYRTMPGYDEVTGIGVPNVQALINLAQ